MNPFNSIQISALLLFFTGIKIIHWCNSMERRQHMKRKTLQANLLPRQRWQDLQDSWDLIRKSLAYSILGLTLALIGITLFFTSMN